MRLLTTEQIESGEGATINPAATRRLQQALNMLANPTFELTACRIHVDPMTGVKELALFTNDGNDDLIICVKFDDLTQIIQDYLAEPI